MWQDCARVLRAHGRLRLQTVNGGTLPGLFHSAVIQVTLLDNKHFMYSIVIPPLMKENTSLHYQGIPTYTKLAHKIEYDFTSYLCKQIFVELCNVPATGGISVFTDPWS